MQDDRCIVCRKKLGDGNRISAGGGGVTPGGKWHSWKVGECCYKPLTDQALKKKLLEVFSCR